MESTRRNLRLTQNLLKWGVTFLLLAFAWEYWRWGSPIRSLLWDENLFSPVITLLGWEWTDWVTSLAVENWIQVSSYVCVFIFTLGAIASFFYPSSYRKSLNIVLVLATIILIFQAILKTKSHFWQLGQIMELTLQWCSPVLLIVAYSDKYRPKHLGWLMRISIAVTFIGHGLYAIGYHPVPGHFLDMMMNGFGMSQSTALLCLHIVGWVDIIAAFILLIPNPKWIKPVLVYIIIWGFMTAIARLWSNAPFYSTQQLAEQWLSESGIRWVHFLVPLSLYCHYFYAKIAQSNNI